MEDHLYKLLKFYKGSPAPFKSLLGNVYRKAPLRLRYSNIYFDTIDLLEKSRWWPREKLAEYQWHKVEKTINHAYKNVPYYRNLFNEWNIRPQQIQNFHDFKQIPYLTKELIKNNIDQLTATNLPGARRLYVTTGGTTGTPMGFYYQKNISRPREEAFILRLWQRIGYQINDKIAVLRGHIIQNAQRKNFCETEPIKNRLLLSSFHMTEANLPIYIEKIKKFKPKYLHVYPSSLTVLANYMKRNSIPGFAGLKAIFASSEMAYPWQIKLFSDVFGCRIFQWYGQVEMCALAGNCEVNDGYHIFPEYSYVELIEDDAALSDKNGRYHEIVGTTFDNDVMPLIRYRTCDYATLSDHACQCGRDHTIMRSIVGRKQEFFVDKTNSIITFVYADVPFWDVKDKIRAYQYIQEAPGTVQLNIDATHEFDNLDLNLVENQLKEIYPGITFNVDKVAHIPKNKNGKFNYLIQQLPINSYLN